MQAADEIYYRQNNAFRLNLVWAHTSSQRNGGYRYPITTKNYLLDLFMFQNEPI